MTSDLDTQRDAATAGGEDVPTDEAKTLQLTVDVATKSACERHVTVTVARADIDRYFDEEFSKLMPEAKVPGFRAGRAPRKLVEGHFRKQVIEQIKGRLLLDCMTQVTTEEDFSAISEPDFDFEAVDIPEEGDLTFEFDIEVRPDFNMPEWRGLKLDRPVRKVGKAEVDEELARMLEHFAVLEPTEEPAAMGDVLTVKMTFTRDGKTIGPNNEVAITLREHLSFQDAALKGFGKLMKGAKSGDKRSATVTVAPEAEEPALRGEDVNVDFEVLDVKRVVLPKLDDAMLARFGGIESEGDLRDAVKANLERQMFHHQGRRIREQITSFLTEAADWELPPDLLRRQSQRELERAVMELRRNGFSDAQIQHRTNELRQNSMSSTAIALKEHFILERIAEQQEFEATDADYDAEIQLIAAQSGDSVRATRARIDKRGLWDALRNQIVERKVVQLIQENAKMKDVPFKAPKQDFIGVDVAVGGKSQTHIPNAKHGGDEQELKQAAERS